MEPPTPRDRTPLLDQSPTAGEVTWFVQLKHPRMVSMPCDDGTTDNALVEAWRILDGAWSVFISWRSKDRLGGYGGWFQWREGAFAALPDEWWETNKTSFGVPEGWDGASPPGHHAQ